MLWKEQYVSLLCGWTVEWLRNDIFYILITTFGCEVIGVAYTQSTKVICLLKRRKKIEWKSTYIRSFKSGIQSIQERSMVGFFVSHISVSVCVCVCVVGIFFSILINFPDSKRRSIWRYIETFKLEFVAIVVGAGDGAGAAAFFSWYYLAHVFACGFSFNIHI